jgi:hypothetical protein
MKGRERRANPPNVRTYIIASTQHAPAPLPTRVPIGTYTG